MNKRLKILHLNIRSLRNKLQYLEAILNEDGCDTDLIAITETWLYKNETEYMNIENYNAIFKCREDSRGGGLAIYIKQNLKYLQRNKYAKLCGFNCNANNRTYKHKTP